MIRDHTPLKSQTFDLLIVGGGIYGAWIAYDASLRGLKVALIEKSDFASGTSSASTKLIHGGLRYLEYFWFQIIKKSLNEREQLFKIAPHRVKPLQFVFPLYKFSRVKTWQLKMGLRIYDFLARAKSQYQYQKLNNENFKIKYAFLKNNQFCHAFSYWDGVHDDARFVLEIIDGARSQGACVYNYIEAQNIKNNQPSLISVDAYDSINHENIQISSKILIDASGAWSRQWNRYAITSQYTLSKGTHIVFPNDLKLKEALLLLHPDDQRVFFVIPWYQRLLIGTTDVHYTQDPDMLKSDDDEIQYLMEGVNYYFKKQFTKEQIIQNFCGLRVFATEKKGHPSDRTREWLYTQYQNIYMIRGGKFSSSRLDAVWLVDKIMKKHFEKVKYEIKATEIKTLPWSDANHLNSKKQYLKQFEEMGIHPQIANNIAERYGIHCEKVLMELVKNPSLAQPIGDTVFVLGELIYSIKNEYVYHLEDLIRRRVPLVLVMKWTVNDLKQLVHLLSQYLELPFDWDREIPEIAQKYGF